MNACKCIKYRIKYLKSGLQLKLYRATPKEPNYAHAGTCSNFAFATVPTGGTDGNRALFACIVVFLVEFVLFQLQSASRSGRYIASPVWLQVL